MLAHVKISSVSFEIFMDHNESIDNDLTIVYDNNSFSWYVRIAWMIQDDDEIVHHYPVIN